MNALQKGVTGLAAIVLAGVGSLSPVQAQDVPVPASPVQVDMLQVSVGKITTFYAVVRNFDADNASIDIRISLPEGATYLASYAGVPDENEGAVLDGQVGWINLAVPGGGASFGPFSITIESEKTPVCSKTLVYYNTPNVSGETSSPELCNTSFISATPGYSDSAD